jgi:hypothetical protein
MLVALLRLGGLGRAGLIIWGSLRDCELVKCFSCEIRGADARFVAAKNKINKKQKSSLYFMSACKTAITQHTRGEKK